MRPTTSGGHERQGSPQFPPGLLAVGPSSEMNALMQRTPWSETVLGPVQEWAAELRTAVGVCLNSPFPMLVMWGPDLAMVYNDAFVPILGDKHPALGQPCAHVWSDAWPVVGSMLTGVLERGESTYHQDLPLVLRRHGFDETVYFTFAYSAIPKADGTVGGVFTVVAETTTQVLGTRRLRHLRELGQARSAQISDPERACAAATAVLATHREDVPFGVVYLLDEDGVTARAVSWFGLTEPPSARLPLLPPTVPGHTAPTAAGDDWIWRALATDSAQTRTGLEPLLRDRVLPLPEAPGPAVVDKALALPLAAAGADRPHGVVVLGASPYLALDDPYREYLSLAADHLTAAVTDARARAAQLRRAEELAELDRARTKFFTSVSHELRTPLTLIAGPAEDALTDRRHPLAAPQRQRLEIIHRNTGRLRRLVDTLLDFSRIEDGGLRSEPVAVDLGALTRGIAESFASAVERAQLDFTVDCPIGSPPVLVDPGMWEQIVLNLLSNAVKFTLRGGIRLSLRATADIVELSVADTGIGIAADELPHIFERFRQVREANGRSHEGSGIGLALVRELASLHDGVALAASQPGRGTTLTVRLPARPAGDAPPVTPDHRRIQDHVSEVLQWSTPVEDPDLRTRAEVGTSTVLVAEDNADLRAYLRALLAPEHLVTLAADGHQALRLARERRPDLILADVMMPGLDGFALLRALRADPATARTPVVLLSARAGQEAAAEGLAAGADDYLAKPFSSADLLARVRSNLDLARLRNHESAWRTALVNAMQDGFFVADRNLAVIEINDGFTRLLGYEAPQLPWPVPHPWWPTPEQDSDGYALVDAALSVVRAQGHGRFVLPLRHRDGRRLWVDVTLDSLRDHSGIGQLLVGTLRDVTVARLTAERDAAISRLAGLLTGVDDSVTVLSVGLAELRDCWQAKRVSVLHWPEPSGPVGAAATVSTLATTGPATPTGGELPPPSAVDDARQGRLFTDALSTDAKASRPSAPDTDALVSTVGAPLFDGGGQAMLWLEFDQPRPYSLADRTLLVQLTGHLQLALSRARASDEQRRVALALQRAILGPADLPPAFAARYEPAASSLEVGGDWYDVIELPGGRYGVVVGDVVGRGLTAATTMGQLRSAARALQLENDGPAQVLRTMDRFAALLPGAFCTTVFCAVIDPAARTVRYSSAGHLPALLRRPDATVRRLDDAQSVPLAIPTDRERPETTITLPPGSYLLLYTDGLVERRHEIIDSGIERAEAALAAISTALPGTAVDRLYTQLLDHGRHEDDVALLLYYQV